MPEPQIQYEDKWDSGVVTGETLEEAALKLFEQRYADGFWYDNWDDGDPNHQYADRADAIHAAQNGEVAWQFLRERSDHEYEWVERARVI